MGIQNHNAVLASTWSKEVVAKLEQWLTEKKLDTFVLRTDEKINGYVTFLFPPDGSKEGWDDSDYWDAIREQFIKRLEADNYGDGSSPWDWVEVGYGEYGQKVLRGNNKNQYNEKEYA